MGTEGIVIIGAIVLLAFIEIILLFKINNCNEDIGEYGKLLLDHSEIANQGAVDEKRVKLRKVYYAFVELISVFPLLGMLGTVLSLISFSGNMSAENMDIIRNNYFSALYTTVAGMIAAVVFKIINAYISARVELRLEQLDEIVSEFIPKSNVRDRKYEDM